MPVGDAVVFVGGMSCDSGTARLPVVSTREYPRVYPSSPMSTREYPRRGTARLPAV